MTRGTIRKRARRAAESPELHSSRLEAQATRQAILRSNESVEDQSERVGKVAERNRRIHPPFKKRTIDQVTEANRVGHRISRRKHADERGMISP